MEIKNILTLIGAVTILTIITTFIYILYEVAKEKLIDLRLQHKIKHRFDKPPTAQCYCKDCLYYKTYNGFGKCRRGHIKEDWNIADSWFCWQATPSTRNIEKDAKEN